MRVKKSRCAASKTVTDVKQAAILILPPTKPAVGKSLGRRALLRGGSRF